VRGSIPRKEEFTLSTLEWRTPVQANLDVIIVSSKMIANILPIKTRRIPQVIVFEGCYGDFHRCLSLQMLTETCTLYLNRFGFLTVFVSFNGVCSVRINRFSICNVRDMNCTNSIRAERKIHGEGFRSQSGTRHCQPYSRSNKYG